jgi:hypothetical protein
MPLSVLEPSACGFSYVYIKRHKAKANTLVILFEELPAIHSIPSGKSPTEKAGIPKIHSPFMQP